MLTYLRNELDVFRRYQPLLRHLVGRDLKVKYRRSALGILWSFLNPLLMMIVQYFVFSRIFRIMNADIPDFAVYLLSGQMVFNFFSEATNLAMDSVLGGAGLIKKVYIPKYIFPLEKVLFSFVNGLVTMLALVVVIVFTGVTVTPWMLMIPVPLLLLAVFNFGVGLILSSLTVFFRDIKHFYGVFLMALNYLTPIFYSETFLGGGKLGTIVRLNPVYWYVMMMRQVIMGGTPPGIAPHVEVVAADGTVQMVQQAIVGTAPLPMQWIVCVGSAVLAVLIGLVVFKKCQDKFILHM